MSTQGLFIDVFTMVLVIMVLHGCGSMKNGGF